MSGQAGQGWVNPFYQSPPTGVVVEGDYGTFTLRIIKRDGQWLDEHGKPLISGRPRNWRLLGDADE